MSIESVSEETPGPPALSGDLTLGPVHLIVAALDHSVEWYQRVLGLRVHTHDVSASEMGDGTRTVVVLHEDPQAGPAGRHAGLYHYALLYPSRLELARAAARLIEAEAAIEGTADHGTHEAIYLADPDGNGIELAADRPRNQWPADLGYHRGPAPLDSQGLISVLEEGLEGPVGDGLRVGHLHLHVGDVAQGLRFYRDLIGFEVQALLPSAAFVSAGGYHHHLGFNVWRGHGVGPAPAHTAGLLHWTIELPQAADVDALRERLTRGGVDVETRDRGMIVRDPWKTAVAIVAQESDGDSWADGAAVGRINPPDSAV